MIGKACTNMSRRCFTEAIKDGRYMKQFNALEQMGD